MAAELCHFQLAKLGVVAVVAQAVVAPSEQTLWGISSSWYQLTKKCTFSLILNLLPWIWYQNEVLNMVYEYETVKFKHLPITLTFYTDSYSKQYSFLYGCVQNMLKVLGD